MDVREQILKVLNENEPMSAGQIAEKTGLDKKIVEKEMDKLKKENLIVSPKRCYWTVNK
ncbi:MAG TPA: HTH domain-containing protein [Bacteroidales bacterium]|nr:HTH domain-containing protein [Bacteroidales bacterium]HOL97542.1 HTH domain-containing protein [Bacteroidales bacterium]HOM35810.1 HTH domain-containing protein [Bacteroidales bacterium]HPD22972.1 HTH domain-containing protein [Bacteroidales bacterium]HRS98812.1 HTH domain-containing protein [Bacteroidales bacterium]